MVVICNYYNGLFALEVNLQKLLSTLLLIWYLYIMNLPWSKYLEILKNNFKKMRPSFNAIDWGWIVSTIEKHCKHLNRFKKNCI